jgi:hypothetical protein
MIACSFFNCTVYHKFPLAYHLGSKGYLLVFPLQEGVMRVSSACNSYALAGGVEELRKSDSLCGGRALF